MKKWQRIIRGDGLLIGFIEVFWTPSINKWTTIPGFSRWKTPEGVIEEI